MKLLAIVIISNFKSLKAPYKVFLVVTKSCGSRCGNCLIWKEEVKDELTLDDYEKLSKKLGRSLYWLNISGGEPTDRKDLPQIIDCFVRNCKNLLCLNLTTNALNLEELNLLKIYLSNVNIPVIRINVSVDGPAKLHDRIRGTPGGYIKAIEAIKLFRNTKNIKVMAAMTLHDSNKDAIPETFAELNKHLGNFNKKSFHVNLSHHSQHYYGNRQQDNGKNLPIHDLKEYFSIRFPDFLLPVGFVEYVYRKKIETYLRKGQSPVKCASMSANLYISEKGSIYPCTIWDKKIGELKDYDFDLKAILDSQKYREVRNEIIQKKCPGCWTPCEAYPSILGDIKGSVLR